MTAATTLNSSVLLGAPYPIWVGDGIFSAGLRALSLASYTRVVAVIDDSLFDAWEAAFAKELPAAAALVRFKISEQEKSLESATKLWNAFLSHALDRKSIVLAIGGGVLCDVVGFAAATYMRGCAFAILPTSLLAQVDASVGGKTGVNFSGIKNVIGVIRQPCAVLIETSFLRSLPQRELCNGAAEMIKHGLIADKNHFDEMSRLAADVDVSQLSEIIKHSLAIKLEIVSRDPTELGARKLLNFGHSIGHAIEASALEAGAALSHGEAVSIGMVAEAYLSERAGLLSSSELEQIETVLQRWQLPVRLSGNIPRERIMSKLVHDKKNVAGDVRMTLLKTLGQAVFDCSVSASSIHECLDYVFRANQSK